MIHLSTNKIILKSSPEELFDFLGKTEGIAQILAFKKTKHLKVEGDVITFILKWAARFNFSISEITPNHILIESKDGVEFKSAFRFDIMQEENGSSISIHTETDTAPFVDFYFERQMKNWMEAIAKNLESQFG